MTAEFKPFAAAADEFGCALERVGLAPDWPRIEATLRSPGDHGGS